MRYRFIILSLVLLFATPLTSFGQTDETSQTEDKDEEAKKQYIYKWKDDRGNIHISTDLGKIPEKYRRKAERILQPPAQEVPTTGTGQVPALSEPEEKGDDQALKAAWQERLRNAKERLAEAEAKYKRLQTEKEGLFRAWGSPAYAPISVRERAVHIEEELEEAQKEIDDARHELEVTIPEDARKAGIPPGWLRE